MSSPFTSKPGTNYRPDEGILGIQTLLAGPTLRLRRLDNEIATLQMTLNKLTVERASLGAYVDAHEALLSPAQRMPLEIIRPANIYDLPPNALQLCHERRGGARPPRAHLQRLESHLPLDTT
ncbi:hypothetical protein B0H17DRAFT_1295145, partial [Mycena rosella]